MSSILLYFTEQSIKLKTKTLQLRKYTFVYRFCFKCYSKFKIMHLTFQTVNEGVV